MAVSSRPNVIVFFTDQQRWDSTGLHGNPLGLTPHFDRLASAGTHLYHSFTCQPVCGPARSCLQTGLYATETGCFRNGIPLPPHLPTLAHYFRKGGYETGYIGKWHLSPKQKNGSQAVEKKHRGGYEYWLGAHALEHSSDAYDCVVYDHRNQEVKLPGYRVDALTDAAIRFIDQKRKKPYFLFLSYLEPHHQNHRDDYPPPTGYRELYTGRWTPPDLLALRGTSPEHLGGYWGMVKRLDEALGRLVDALKSLGQLENTILLFTSDHGCHFKTRNSEYKRSCHESSIRVPTFLHGPGLMGGGQIRAMTSLVDLPPTLLEAAGLPIPKLMQGKSILPLVQKKKSRRPAEAFIQISESQIGRALRTSRWKYSVKSEQSHGRDVSTADVYHEEFLYDLENDPYELNNLIGFKSHQDVARILRSKLLKRIAKVEGKKPAIIPAPVKPSGQRHVDPSDIPA